MENVVNIGSDIAGTAYDAATANWAAPWRMPTRSQCAELIDKCTSVWTTQNGVIGRKFTGTNGETIFFPATGNRWIGELFDAGLNGFYWSSTLGESYPYGAWGLFFDSGEAYVSYFKRSEGHSVRPVR